jgi:hypothetical protein
MRRSSCSGRWSPYYVLVKLSLPSINHGRPVAAAIDHPPSSARNLRHFSAKSCPRE